MTARTLRVLFLDDDPANMEMVTESLARSGMAVVTERVDSPEAFRQALREFAPDVVLSDDALENFDARAALEVVQNMRPTAPLIVVADATERHSAGSFVRAGAEDLVLKSCLDRLAATIECAIAVRRRLEKLTPRQMEVLRLMSRSGADSRNASGTTTSPSTPATLRRPSVAATAVTSHSLSHRFPTRPK